MKHFRIVGGEGGEAEWRVVPSAHGFETLDALVAFYALECDVLPHALVCALPPTHTLTVACTCGRLLPASDKYCDSCGASCEEERRE